MPQSKRSRAAGAVLTAAIVGLTLATAYIHSTLGGLLFTLNALGYLGLAALIVIGAAAPTTLIERFSWFPRVALLGYTLMTIVGYLVEAVLNWLEFGDAERDDELVELATGALRSGIGAWLRD